MQAKDLFNELYPHVELYKQLHNQTADMDLKIIELLCVGKNAIQIAMDVPCAEATVYRAKERMVHFLYDELPRVTVNMSDTLYIHNSVARGTYSSLNLQSHKLYYLLIHAQQNYKNYVEAKIVHEHMPGLRNRVQRESTLLELNEFQVAPDEMPKHSIKVFEYVVYDQAKYKFKLTKEALPYFDRGYALLKMLGIEVLPE